MSGFGAFESNFGDQHIQDEDPAAEFLAREQDELAGIEDEGFLGNNVDEPQGEFVDYNGITEDFEQPTIEDVVDEFENDYPVNGFSESTPIDAPPPSRPIFREEPEKIKKWREEQQVMLQHKDAEEDKKKEELRESAKKELEDWYKHYAEQVVKTKATNRNAEREYVMERDADTPGQEWERIAKLCDFNPKSSKHNKDISRMRSIILQLKQAPIVKK